MMRSISILAPELMRVRGLHLNSRPLGITFLKVNEINPLTPICMKARFTYWKESDGRYLGFLNGYPDHWTQGKSLGDLKDHLRDLFQTFTREQIPGIRKSRRVGNRVR
jgi:hypothetical protein